MSIDLFMIFNIFLSALIHMNLWNRWRTRATIGIALYLILFYLILGFIIGFLPSLYLQDNFQSFRNG